MNKTGNIRASAAVIASGVLWGTINIYIKNLSAAGLDALQICFIRMLVAAIVFTAFLAIKDPSKLKFKIRDIWMFLCTGIVSVVLFNCLYFYTMINSQASVAVVLLYTSPVFIMILAAIFFKEKITWQKVLALVLTFGGCVLVAGVFGSSDSIAPLTILTGVLAGLFYGLYSIFGRVALAHYDTTTVTAWTFIFGLIGIIPFGKVTQTFETFAANPVLILWGLGVSIFSTVLPYFLYTWGLQRMDAGKAGILVAVEPLVGALIGILVFHESHNATKLVGIVLILAAIVLLNLNFKKKNSGQ